MSREAMFALYRGEEFVDLGTKKDLAARHGMRPETVYFMSTPTYHRRSEGHEARRLMAYRIEMDDETED